MDSSGTVSILEDDLNSPSCMRCSPNHSTTFRMISEAVAANYDIRLSVLKSGETATLMETVTDAETGAAINSFSHSELVNRAGTAVPYSDGSWDILLPEGGSLVENLYGDPVLQTTNTTMTPHEIAHTLGEDAIDVENKVRDENRLPRRSGNDHFDPARRRSITITSKPEEIDVGPSVINTTLILRPLEPLLKNHK